MVTLRGGDGMDGGVCPGWGSSALVEVQVSKAGQPLNSTVLGRSALGCPQREAPFAIEAPFTSPKPLFEGQGWLLCTNWYFHDSDQVGEERQLPASGKSQPESSS